MASPYYVTSNNNKDNFSPIKTPHGQSDKLAHNVNDISGIYGNGHNQSSTSFLGEIRALNEQNTPKSKPPLPNRNSKPPRPQTADNRKVAQKKSARMIPGKKVADPQDKVGNDDSDDDDDEF